MLPQAASDFYRAQQRQVVAALALTRREWDYMGEDFDRSWRTIGPKITTLTASAQLGAARNGIHMVPATLAELGQMVQAEGVVDAAAFAGFASDGRPLDSLLYGAVIEAKTANVNSTSERLAAGRAWLDMAVHTQVSDAGRQASGVNAFARPGVGNVRAANPPCCQRCSVLSGKFTRAEVAFKRHPHCDCFNIPTTDPASITAPIIGPDDVKDLTKAQRKAIDDGADMNQVINSRRVVKNADGSYRSLRSKDGLTTTEGTTRRGIAGSSLQGRKRLTPEGIYKIASDRAEALQLLKAHGYLL